MLSSLESRLSRAGRGKVVTGVSSVIANSVALTPRVPKWSKLKLSLAPDLVENVLGFPYLNPQWGEEPGLSRGKLFSKAVSLFHQECDVPACHMLSLMWGTGWPALYSHENLADVTHRRGGDLYGATSMHYYRHVSKMLQAGSRPLFLLGIKKPERIAPLRVRLRGGLAWFAWLGLHVIMLMVVVRVEVLRLLHIKLHMVSLQKYQLIVLNFIK